MPKENWKRAFFIMMLTLILGLSALFFSMFGEMSFFVGLALTVVIWLAGFFIQLLFIRILEAMGYTIMWEDSALTTEEKNDD